MKICLDCSCHIVKMHRNDVDCLKALSREIPLLQKRLQELEAVQHRLSTLPEIKAIDINTRPENNLFLSERGYNLQIGAHVPKLCKGE